jgi:hypothetical protein
MPSEFVHVIPGAGDDEGMPAISVLAGVVEFVFAREPAIRTATKPSARRAVIRFISCPPDIKRRHLAHQGYNPSNATADGDHPS